MALQFILGSSGSGKSNYIYEQIIKQSKEEPNQLFFVIVPEQFTMQTQRELVRRQENHGIMNIDVVSFQRLAYRVFDELGLTNMKVLEETGKSFVLRKVAEEKKDELHMLRANRKKAGYINEVKSMISELAQYRITPGQLLELSEDESLAAPFRYRMNDIQVMYQGFLDYLKGNYITAEEILEVLAQEADRSALLKDCVLVLDGFTGFTPVQYALLEHLMKFAKDIYVTVTMDERETLGGREEMQDLFYMSKKTIRLMSELAKRQQIEIADPVRLSHGINSRFAKAKPLEWLEQNLFRTQMKKYLPHGMDASQAVALRQSANAHQADDTTRIVDEKQHLFLYSLPNPRQEMMFLAGEIKRLVREEGYRYKDIAIVCGDVQMYGNYVAEIFENYEVPYFLDKKNSIAFHPMTEMIKSALIAVEKDFSYESIMAYLRCGLSGLKREEIDLLDNYLLANRIRGFENWKKKWVRISSTQNAEELEAINLLRQQIVAQFEVVAGIWKKGGTVLEKTVALYQFVVELHVQQQLETRQRELEQEGRTALAREYEQIYRIVMDLLNKLTQLLAEEKMDLKEYREILETGFSASSVGIVPPGYDQVLIGDIERTRLPEIKVLFLAGVNDGLIPKNEKQGGLISQQERDILEEYGMELAPGTREKTFIQKFYLYLNLTKPSEKLYLTWFRTGGDGKEARKSYLTGIICKIFPNLIVEKLDGVKPGTQLVTPKSSQRFLVDGIRLAKEGELTPEFLALLNWFRKQPDWSEKADKLLEAAFSTYEHQFMSREITKELYGEVLANSVTRLERFAACAYAHFMNYGIGLKERQIGEFAPVDMGSMFHDALERYSMKMEEAGYHWFDVPKEKQEQMAEEAVAETVEEAGYLLYQDARTSYTVQRILRILKKTIETIGSQISQSNFAPEGYEVSFSFAQNLDAVNFTLSEQEKMRLQGRIDRMDTSKDGNRIYVKVVDYKSGNTQFSLVSLYHGLQLQLVVYLNAAVDILKQKYPGQEVVPAGMFYYHIDDPVIEAKGNPSEEEIRDKIFEQLKLNGIGTDNEDGSVSKKSQKAGQEEMQLLSQFVNTKIRQIGRRIYDGDIQVNPYMMKDKTGCDYCPYHGICGFDGKVPGYEYRRLAEEKDSDVLLEKMKKEVEHGDDIYRGTAEGH